MIVFAFYLNHCFNYFGIKKSCFTAKIGFLSYTLLISRIKHFKIGDFKGMPHQPHQGESKKPPKSVTFFLMVPYFKVQTYQNKVEGLAFSVFTFFSALHFLKQEDEQLDCWLTSKRKISI